MYDFSALVGNIQQSTFNASEPGGGGVLSMFDRRGCAVFQGIVFGNFF